MTHPKAALQSPSEECCVASNERGVQLRHAPAAGRGDPSTWCTGTCRSGTAGRRRPRTAWREHVARTNQGSARDGSGGRGVWRTPTQSFCWAGVKRSHDATPIACESRRRVSRNAARETGGRRQKVYCGRASAVGLPPVVAARPVMGATAAVGTLLRVLLLAALHRAPGNRTRVIRSSRAAAASVVSASLALTVCTWSAQDWGPSLIQS